MPADKVKILAVDDVPENLTALEALLRSDGLELLQARSGPEALELLLVHDVALALLDVNMPGMNGFELAEFMRGTERTRRVPIIFLTAAAGDERRRFRGYETGAVDYLLKPVDTQLLRNKVDIFVELARQRQEIAEQRDQLSAALGRVQAHSDNSPLAVVEFDADFCIRTWSKGAERLFGWTAAEVEGVCLPSLKWINEEDATALSALLEEFVSGDRARHMQAQRVFCQNGEALHSEWYCSALRDAAGKLVSINVQILDVSERRRAEETQKLLIGELNHRVKNTLASVQAIATQTLRHAAEPAAFAPTFIGRIHALARAHSLLSSATWQGASLRELVNDQLQLGTIDESRLTVEGPDIDLPPETALHLALVIHELATNANKYGALSTPEGRLSFTWQASADGLALVWAEQGGPAVEPPSRRGFGTALIQRSIQAEGGTAEPAYLPNGLQWRFTLPNPGVILPPAAPSPAPAPAAPASPLPKIAASVGALAGRRVLVIEDEPLVALELVSILEEAGAEIIGPAATAEGAIETIRATRPDAALLDGNLQGASVEAVAETLTSLELPFLFVSGYGRDHLPDGFRHIAVIGKPFDGKQLVARVVGMLEAAPALVA
ncbi:response regulator [Sphingomonas sp. IC-56]|uniref:response regulator n=1 Tax=Sphingomonas sp. IC-56 TaxID=2898529 RepID=UPI001E582121|nr:response regulator [Sphingomonas sp. IC-56]MCD2324172.1 response regulator [Sphingomonas sp. IC-56]